MLVEKTIMLDSADAVAILVSGRKLICYSHRLGEAERDFLSPHLTAALGEQDHLVRAITVPAGSTARMQRTGFYLSLSAPQIPTQRCAGCTCADVPDSPPTLPMLPIPTMPAS